MRLVIYGDFNCPFSALASRRAEALERAGKAQVDWRAVEHAPEIPPGGEKVLGALADELDGELDHVRRLLHSGEVLSLRRPAVRSNTAAAVAAYAALDEASRRNVRWELFRRYWEEGQDLADESVLLASGLPEGVRSGGVAAVWRDEWLGLGPPVVPAMRLPDGDVCPGFDALARLAELLNAEA